MKKIIIIVLLGMSFFHSNMSAMLRCANHRATRKTSIYSRCLPDQESIDQETTLLDEITSMDTQKFVADIKETVGLSTGVGLLVAFSLWVKKVCAEK